MKNKAASKTATKEHNTEQEHSPESVEQSRLDIHTYHTSTYERIAIEKLRISTLDPRIVDHSKQIDAIMNVLQEHKGVPLDMALHVRPTEDQFEILSDPVVYEAALKTEIKEIPCFVLSLQDFEAHLSMAVHNSRRGWRKLELGRHIYNCVQSEIGGRSKEGGRSEFARTLNLSPSYVSELSNAGEVYEQLSQTIRMSEGFVEKTSHLNEISKVDQNLWEILAQTMIEEKWTVKATQQQVKQITEILEIVPAWWDTGKPLLVQAIKHEQSLDKLKSVLTNVLKAHRQIEVETQKVSSSSNYLPLRLFETKVTSLETLPKFQQLEEINKEVWLEFPDLKQTKTMETSGTPSSEERQDIEAPPEQRGDQAFSDTSNEMNVKESAQAAVSSTSPLSHYNLSTKKVKDTDTPSENKQANSATAETSPASIEEGEQKKIPDLPPMQMTCDQLKSGISAEGQNISMMMSQIKSEQKEDDTKPDRIESIDDPDLGEKILAHYDSRKNEFLQLLKTASERVERETVLIMDTLYQILVHHMNECEKFKEKLLKESEEVKKKA